MLHVPRAREPITVDARFEGKKVWEAEAGNTRNFKDEQGQGMVPYSEAKLRWRGDTLYLMLYAGDLDLEGRAKRMGGDVEKDDAFRFEFGAGREVRRVSVSVLGTVADSRCKSSRVRRRLVALVGPLLAMSDAQASIGATPAGVTRVVAQPMPPLR